VRIFDRILTGSYKFPTEEIVSAQNFDLANNFF